jgi:hypothetical protein
LTKPAGYLERLAQAVTGALYEPQIAAPFVI